MTTPGLKSPHGNAIGHCDSPLHREVRSVLVADRLHQPDGLRQRGDGILAQLIHKKRVKTEDSDATLPMPDICSAG